MHLNPLLAILVYSLVTILVAEFVLLPRHRITFGGRRGMARERVLTRPHALVKNDLAASSTASSPKLLRMVMFGRMEIIRSKPVLQQFGWNASSFINHSSAILVENLFTSLSHARKRLKMKNTTEGLVFRQVLPPDGRALLTAVPPITEPSSDGRIIYYLHIHKNAGSTMCIAAKENGLKVSEKNCNVQSDQRCCGGSDSFSAQAQYAETTQYQFVANEQDMYVAMDTAHYRYVTTLRNSYDRYLSHWMHVVRRYHPSYRETFRDWWKHQPDNWAFRKICGTKCRNVGKYQITPGLFNETMERVHQFDDFLFVERFNESFTKFAHNVAWKWMPVSKGTKKVVSYPDHNSSEWDPLMSALDNAVYEIAQGLYQKLPRPVFSDNTLAELTEYFAQGPLRKCRTPCCTSVCSQY